MLERVVPIVTALLYKVKYKLIMCGVLTGGHWADLA